MVLHTNFYKAVSSYVYKQHFASTIGKNSKVVRGRSNGFGFFPF